MSQQDLFSAARKSIVAAVPAPRLQGGRCSAPVRVSSYTRGPGNTKVRRYHRRSDGCGPLPPELRLPTQGGTWGGR